jgi:hypothetical protein
MCTAITRATFRLQRTSVGTTIRLKAAILSFSLFLAGERQACGPEAAAGTAVPFVPSASRKWRTATSTAAQSRPADAHRRRRMLMFKGLFQEVERYDALHTRWQSLTLPMHVRSTGSSGRALGERACSEHYYSKADHCHNAMPTMSHEAQRTRRQAVLDRRIGTARTLASCSGSRQACAADLSNTNPGQPNEQRRDLSYFTTVVLHVYSVRPCAGGHA